MFPAWVAVVDPRLDWCAAQFGISVCVWALWQSWVMRYARWLGGAMWIGSWYLMYLEITRWHHVRLSLVFNSDVIPGTGLRSQPGFPLILLYTAFVAAPLVTVVGFVRQIHPGHVAR